MSEPFNHALNNGVASPPEVDPLVQLHKGTALEVGVAGPLITGAAFGGVLSFVKVIVSDAVFPATSATVSVRV